MSKPLQHITAPGRIGQIPLRNRMIMTPMGSNTAAEGGFCSEQTVSYYEARARGGAAMLIMGSVSVAWPRGSSNYRHIALSDDKYIPGLQQLVEAVHAHDCRVAAQLHHGGLMAFNEAAVGHPTLCPSAPQGHSADEMTPFMTAEELGIISAPMQEPTFNLHYKEADDDDIRWVIDVFVAAAERAKRIGFDGVEIHAGHGYLIANFLNPSVNRRQDRYGGCIENRSRLLVEIITEIKARVGAEYPVWFRLDSVHFTDDGITNEDAQVTARLAVAAGADAVHCSADGDHAKGTCYSDGHATHTPGRFVPFAAAIKAQVAVPVICPGRIEPEVGDRLIGDGQVDFITMGRKLLADPDLPNKILENRPQDIRPCIYCYTCISNIFVNNHIRCAVNAMTGFESERDLIGSDRARKILVIGGGPAGMEAARVAALRGHRVTLVEKASRLGGTVYFSGVSYPPNGRLVAYLQHQVRQLPITVALGVEVTPDYVARQAPDAVVVAVGAAREMPEVEGIDLPHVFSGDDMRSMITGDDAEQVKGRLSSFNRMMLGLGSASRITRNIPLMRSLSKLWMPIGKRVVMIGGGLVAVELAEFLAERGRQVTLLDEGTVFGKETPLVRRWRNLADIRKLGVRCLPNARVIRIRQGLLTYVNALDQERTIAADCVIVTSGTVANTSLAERLRQQGYEVHMAGDCSQVGYIEGAMHGGFKVGAAL
ncbi:MAG: FAD-dependent oxidoreductase [Gammaproteobacteria bacterium]|uniref:oxidoreductase n=1 Tax=Pseudomaricurvus alcaniphilus TaxID=1166482 RepID=UPI00140B0C6F|nr:FAD-dependent oxidoreductase [Pseudomaricurvus alcaniphilus]MBR9910625.1 FAD-dependent oxidoreductase [Gammaproteobacteria bacterium]NHN36852.1 FAD-dependent oxidoreductase [Pseudomaricurvus alcaniphilus]